MELQSGETIAHQQRIVNPFCLAHQSLSARNASQRFRYYIRLLITFFRSLAKEIIGVNGLELAGAGGDGVFAGEEIVAAEV